MNLFNYTAVDGEGKKVRGTCEAESREAAMGALETKSIYVTHIEEASEDKRSRGSISLSFRPAATASDIVLFNRRLATLVAADIPLLESLDAIERQMENQRFRSILLQVKEDVRQGSSFSEAIARHPGIFPDLMVSMVRVGEAGGILAPILEQLADFTERDNEVRTEVRNALAYPTLVLIVATLTVIFLMTSVVPRLSQMFTGMAVTLPLPTRLLMSMSDIATSYGIFLLLALLVAGVFIFRFTRSPEGKEAWDRGKLRLPMIGGLVKKATIARFARSLGALVRGGVPLMEGLHVVNRVLNNRVLSSAVDRIMDRVRKGDSMAAGMRQEEIFPDMVKYMISAGEDSGNLDAMLFKIADMYEMESRQSIKVTINLLAPLMILVVALIVLFIALSMLLPIFRINQMIG